MFLPKERPKRILALDAMGVLYRAGDDVAELLIPFVAEHNPVASHAAIETAYKAASLGQMEPDEFWRRFDVRPELEDEYLGRHELHRGVQEMLSEAPRVFCDVGCISNDVDRWSRKLRLAHGLEPAIRHWSISGAVGSRKPSKDLYLHFAKLADATPGDIVFVDDRPANVQAAIELGFQGLLFAPNELAHQHAALPTISRLEEVLQW